MQVSPKWAMRYRTQTDIVSQILEAANGGATKTKIMYKAYLSYAQLKDYLSILLENDLVESDCSGQSYTTTNKGQRFLKLYSRLGTYMKRIELEIPPVQVNIQKELSSFHVPMTRS